MNLIVNHIINMAPFMLFALIIYIPLRLVFLKNKRARFKPFREAVLLLFVIFMAGLYSQAVIPKIIFERGGITIINTGTHSTNLIPFRFVAETFDCLAGNKNISYFIINILGNIIMFMPIGFLVPSIWHFNNKKVLFIGFLSSLFIEISQLFLPRSSDVDDLILNTFGVFLGLLLYRFSEIQFKKRTKSES